jgi:predicted PurR-regulated permease PerM
MGRRTTTMARPRWHLPKAKTGETPERASLRLGADEVEALGTVFQPPRWLRHLGLGSWYLVGALLVLVGLIWLLGKTQTIVGPLLVAAIVAVVASPAVAWIERKGAPRFVGAIVVLLTIIALAVLIVLLVVGGLVSQSDAISANGSNAVDTIEGWIQDLGVNESGASSISSTLEDDVPQIISTFVSGIQSAISGITSLVFALTFAVFGLFFFLKDGPTFRAAIDSHMGVPLPVARTISGQVIGSLRRYFLGVTIVASFNALVVGLGALALGVPLAGTIAVVTFVTAYIPFIGAFISGAFAVILALGSEGTETAVIMLIIVILANGLLQNIVQPIAFGATLELNPLVVLFVTISAGCLFGTLGLILAAPLVSAAKHIVAELGGARREMAETAAKAEPPPEAAAPG